MRIVSKAELLEMPRGTLFAEYSDGHLNPYNGLMIFVARNPAVESDFTYRSFDGPICHDFEEHIDRVENMEERGESYPVDLYISREGLYDKSMRYWVWEPDDVERIIHLLRGGDEDRYDTE